MIFLIPIVTLLLSFFMPWFYICAFAALLATAKTYSPHQMGKIFFLILTVHGVAAVVLDQLAHGLVSERIAGLFSLPLSGLVYPMAALPPAALFLSTIWVITAGRKLVEKKRVKAE